MRSNSTTKEAESRVSAGAINSEMLRALIRQAGLRSTSARVAVLRWLRQSRSPLSHAEIADALAGEGFDRATIYRNLMDLAEANLVTRTDLGDHMWRFEVKRSAIGGSTESDLHPHFMCTVCGNVSCLIDVNVKISPTAAAKDKKSLAAYDVSEVLLKGRCANCRE